MSIEKGEYENYKPTHLTPRGRWGRQHLAKPLYETGKSGDARQWGVLVSLLCEGKEAEVDIIVR